MSQPPVQVGYSAYPPAPAGPPGVLLWFKIYCILMILMYLVVAAAGVLVLTVEIEPEPGDPDPIVMGAIMLPLGLLLAAVFLIPLMLRPRSWLWVYDLVLICLGLTSLCCFPICIPLLIFWIKPETKAYFSSPAGGLMTG